MRRSSRRFTALLVFVLLPAPRLALAALPKSSLGDYRVHLSRLQTLIHNCESSASACDPGSVGDDEQVEMQGLGSGANVNSFEARYTWLRDALKSAKDAGNESRIDELQGAQRRLDDALRESSGPSTQADIGAARRHADAILGHPEFATARQDSIWEQLVARFVGWVSSLFDDVARFGERSPWIGPVMEWGLVGLALVGVAVWALRVLQRQRLAVRAEADQRIEPWEEAARNWRDLAEKQATHGEWREAVHCLYWASIASLEGRRLWSPNRSRTPREYVRLLEAGSARRKLLGQQTQGFERIWYGLREAAQDDYERALELHEELRAV